MDIMVRNDVMIMSIKEEGKNAERGQYLCLLRSADQTLFPNSRRGGRTNSISFFDNVIAVLLRRLGSAVGLRKDGGSIVPSG